MMNADEKKITFTNQQLAAIIIPLILEQILSVTIGMAAVSYTHLGGPTVENIRTVQSLQKTEEYADYEISFGTYDEFFAQVQKEKDKLPCLTAVSYTHLDVYKRQSYGCMSLKT